MTTDEQIIRGIIAVQMSNCNDMITDPSGPYPPCKNKLGTYICERCGRDVRNRNDACLSVPPEKRWRFK